MALSNKNKNLPESNSIITASLEQNNEVQGFVNNELEIFVEIISGTPGKSAYQLWLDSGYNGTVNDFFAWLKSPDGFTEQDPTVPSFVKEITPEDIDNWIAAYNHSTAPHAPLNAQKNSDITKEEIEAKLKGEVKTHTHNSQYIKKNGDLDISGNFRYDGSLFEFIRPNSSAAWNQGFYLKSRNTDANAGNNLAAFGYTGNNQLLTKFFIGFGHLPELNSAFELTSTLARIKTKLEIDGKATSALTEETDPSETLVTKGYLINKINQSQTQVTLESIRLALEPDINNINNDSMYDQRYARKEDLINVYKFKGNVATFDNKGDSSQTDLMHKDPLTLEVGYTYNVLDENGMNYAFIGLENGIITTNSWDALGFFQEQDLDDYYTKTVIDQKIDDIELTPGPKGDTGPRPEHQWNSTSLRFQKSDGTWGSYVNLKGEDGKDGSDGINGATGKDGLSLYSVSSDFTFENNSSIPQTAINIPADRSIQINDLLISFKKDKIGRITGFDNPIGIGEGFVILNDVQSIKGAKGADGGIGPQGPPGVTNITGQTTGTGSFITSLSGSGSTVIGNKNGVFKNSNTINLITTGNEINANIKLADPKLGQVQKLKWMNNKNACQGLAEAVHYIPSGECSTLGRELRSNIDLGCYVCTSVLSLEVVAENLLTLEDTGIALYKDLFKNVAFSGSYNDLSDKPSIPSLTGYATQTWTNSQGFLKSFTETDPTVPTHVKAIAASNITAWNNKEPAITKGTTSQYLRGDKTWQTLNSTAVGLGNVNNTSDANKPISTATQTALNAKVDKVTGMGLSTNDYTTAEKNKLSGIEAGAQVNPLKATEEETNDGDNDTKYVTPLKLAKKIMELKDGGQITDEGYVDNTFTALQNELESQITLKANDDVVVKTTGDQSISGDKNFLGKLLRNGKEVATMEDLTTVFRYKGKVNTYEDLPTTDLKIGDVWDVSDTGKNFAWNGTQWDDLSGTIDLSNYVTNDELTNILLGYITGNELSTLLLNYVSKVEGKGLSTNDFTTAEKTKLSGIATNAQVNVLEGVQLNGTDVAISSKKSNIVVNKAAVGLGNVDNTSDANKPISTATQTALNAKANNNEVVKLTGNQTISNTKTFNGTLASNGVFKDTLYTWKKSFGNGGTGGTYASWLMSDKQNYRRIWYLRFPSGSNFWGKIKVGFNGGYSSYNASGYISKEINIAFNGANLFNNVGRYFDLGINVENEFRISELIWNTTLACWEIQIYSTIPSSNNVPSSVTVDGVHNGNALYENALNGIIFVNVPSIILNPVTYLAKKSKVNNPDGTATLTDRTVNWSDKPSFQTPYGFSVADRNWVAQQNYLKTFTETDPTVPSHVKAIAASNITAWNNKEPAITKGTTSQYFRGDMSLATFPDLSSYATKSGTSTDAQIKFDNSTYLNIKYTGNLVAYIQGGGVNKQLAFKSDIPSLASYVPTSRTINGKALTENITLAAADVNAIANVTAGSSPSGTSMLVSGDLSNKSVGFSINNAANFRSAIGAGTSNFDGNYASLTNQPITLIRNRAYGAAFTSVGSGIGTYGNAINLGYSIAAGTTFMIEVVGGTAEGSNGRMPKIVTVTVNRQDTNPNSLVSFDTFTFQEWTTNNVMVTYGFTISFSGSNLYFGNRNRLATTYSTTTVSNSAAAYILYVGRIWRLNT